MRRLTILVCFLLLTGCAAPAAPFHRPVCPSLPGQQVLQVQISGTGSSFSPLFPDSAQDAAVGALLHAPLIAPDRSGSPILSGIGGEVRSYRGTDYRYCALADCCVTVTGDGAIYDLQLREDAVFSDGVPLTADDVIFTLYVLLDPSYSGAHDLASLPFDGLEEYWAGASAIRGIQRTGDHRLRLVMDAYHPGDLCQLEVPIAALHHYGDPAQYDYAAQRFGFPKGDLSAVEAVHTPVGLGPYRLLHAGQSLTLIANPQYYLGAPKIPLLQLSTNCKGTRTRQVPRAGYGCVGIHAEAVCVGGEPGSEASRNLRRALATVISAYRAVSVEAYFGEAAYVIDTPLCQASWAVPEEAHTAFSTDVAGRAIRCDAVQETALGFLRAAGYSVQDGQVTAAPPGAKTEYEVLVGGVGRGDHPAYLALQYAAASLGELGITLKVTDVTDFSALSCAVQTGKAELFAFAWETAQDPDLYQVYHSRGSSNDVYGICDETLDALILQARQTPEQDVRRALYGQCLQIIRDWAVEVPLYQRVDTLYFSERLTAHSLPGDLTPYYTWTREAHLLELGA